MDDEQKSVKSKDWVSFGTGGEDFKLGEWLALELGETWRYDHTEQKWHHYDGIRWAPDRTNRISLRVAKAGLKAIKQDAWDAEGKNKLGSDGLKAAHRLYRMSGIAQALESLATMPGYFTDGSDWDQNPYLLGCKNGVVDLRHNKIVESSPDQLVTKSTGVDFEPINGPKDFQRVAPVFMDFLLQVTSDYDWVDDINVAMFLILWFGASLFGMTPEQRFLLMTGSGRNGKGALRHAIMCAVGPEYGMQPDSNLYSRSKMGPARADNARPDLMGLKGKRVTFFSEPDKGQFNEEMLKAHTGGDIITARGLYQKQPISWEPTHAINFLVNDIPSIEDVGASMGSRVMVVDFRHRFEGSLEDKRLYPKLAEEKVGILSILCWAASAWYKSWEKGGQGIVLPERVREQSAAFLERNDPVSEALREAFVCRPDVKCRGKEAYDTYLEWHAASGRDDNPLSMVKFAEALEKKGMTKKKDSFGALWTGLKPMSAMEVAEEAANGDEE